MNDLLPPPHYLGAPDRFNSWRDDQAEALLCAIDTPKRFVGLVLPTGTGKSLVAIMMHILTGKRVAILTSTKGLQDQLSRDFQDLGLIDAKGQSAYECLAVRPGGELFGSVESPATCDRGPCRAKVACSLKENGCLYYDKLREAQRGQLLVTNYAYWMTQYRHGQGLGNFEILVLDEAHAAPDELAQFLSTELRHSDVKSLIGVNLPTVKGTVVEQMATWVQWAYRHAGDLGHQIDRAGNAPDHVAGVTASTKARRDIGRHIRLTHLHRVLTGISKMIPTDWLFHEDVDRTVFDPVWVAGYAEETLFKHIPKIVLMSATFRPKTADLLGLDKADIELYEARSGFDPARRPVYIVKDSPRVDFRITEDGIRKWIGLIDNIMDRRQDRNGVIHTVSYKRRNDIVRLSRNKDRMISHDSKNARQVVEEFKSAPMGVALVSPSVTTGYDFPFSECEYQIITKVPFPDSRDPILKARTAEDADYPAYLAMQELVQAVGRGMRAPTDSCETFVIDAHILWFIGKYRDLAPLWFHEAIKRVDFLPLPLEKL